MGAKRRAPPGRGPPCIRLLARRGSCDGSCKKTALQQPWPWRFKGEIKCAPPWTRARTGTGPKGLHRRACPVRGQKSELGHNSQRRGRPLCPWQEDKERKCVLRRVLQTAPLTAKSLQPMSVPGSSRVLELPGHLLTICPSTPPAIGWSLQMRIFQDVSRKQEDIAAALHL